MMEPIEIITTSQSETVSMDDMVRSVQYFLHRLFCHLADDGVRQYSTIVYRHNILDGRAYLLSQSIDCRFQIQMRLLVGVCVISQK